MTDQHDSTRGRFDGAQYMRFVLEARQLALGASAAVLKLPETPDAVAVAIEARRQLADVVEHLRRATTR